MTYESGNLEPEVFSEDELETLESEAETFHRQHEEPVSIDHVGIGEDGSTTVVQSSIMPHYRLDKQSIAVLIDEAAGRTGITVTDLVGEPDTENRLIIGRQVTLEPNQFSSIEYRTGLQVSYSEHPAGSDGKPIPKAEWNQVTPRPIFRLRPFTAGDYEDMLNLLKASSQE